MVPCGETKCARAGIFIWIFASTDAAAHRNHQVGNSGGDEFDGQRRRQVAGFQTECCGKRSARKRRAREAGRPLRHGDAHRAPIVKREFHGKNSGAGLLQDVHAAFGCGYDAEFRQQKPRADHGMARERQFARGSKNAQTSQRAIIRGPLDENRFGKIHLARDGLHFRGGNAVAISDDRQRISREGFGGENIERVQSAIHVVPLSSPARQRARAIMINDK